MWTRRAGTVVGLVCVVMLFGILTPLSDTVFVAADPWCNKLQNDTCGGRVCYLDGAGGPWCACGPNEGVVGCDPTKNQNVSRCVWTSTSTPPCECKDGWKTDAVTGAAACGDDIDECASNPCHKGAIAHRICPAMGSAARVSEDTVARTAKPTSTSAHPLPVTSRAQSHASTTSTPSRAPATPATQATSVRLTSMVTFTTVTALTHTCSCFT
jgi:hypothetical protein